MFFEIVCAVLTLILTFYCYVIIYSKPHLKGVPGPTSYPLLGCVTQIDSQYTHLTLHQWAKLYGSVYAVRVLTDNWLVLNDYNAIHEVLVTKGDQFIGRPTSYRIGLVSGNHRDVVFANGVDHRWWMPLRKAMQRSIRVASETTTTLDNSSSGCIVTQLTSELMDRLDDTSSQATDVYEHIFEHTMRTTFAFLFGVKPNAGDPRYAEVKMFQQAYIETISPGKGNELDAMPWLRFLGNKTYRQLRDANDACFRFWDDVWVEMKKEFAANDNCIEPADDEKYNSSSEKPKSAVHFIAQLLNPSSRYFDEVIDKENARMAFVDLLIAATVTTIPTFYASLHVLLHHPQVISRLQNEIDDVIGKWPNNLPLLSDRDKMPFAMATVLELLRYTSISPFSVPHTAICDTELLGYRVPKGTIIFPNLWALHHDESFWGDPWTFRPERFLDEGGLLLPPNHIIRKNVMAFGAGPRACIGEPFAMKRIFLFVVMTTQRYDLLPENSLDTCTSCDPRTYECSMALASQPFKTRFVSRT